MEDYIFIIIAILLSVFGAISRKKKQGQAAVEDEDTTAGQRLSVFDELFEDPLFAEEKPQVKPQVVEQSMPRETYQPLVRKIVPISVQRGPVRKLQVAAGMPDHPPKPRMHPLMKDFSLKKAVVYSEILQRKY
ncbi:MAG: hypothetical protein AB2L24_07380 [Mangrovibacterium sp.]